MDNKRDIAFWILVITIVLLIGYVAFFIQSESYQCISNPLVYGVGKYTTSTGYFTCTCSSPFTEPILVTKDDISQLNNYDIFLLPNS